jgi:DNA-directed RNA polymerase subunit alpha
MHIIQEEIGLPKIQTETAKNNYAVFTISPLPSGYGMTLGNAFRRVLLSSLPGGAVTGVKIDGVAHEYSTIPGVQDSVLDIILNLKGLRIKKHSKETEVVKLTVNKEGDVLAKHIEHSSDIEILNPNHRITSITKKGAKLRMELIIEKGVGYVPVASRKKAEKDVGLILVDAIYSPVVKVRYDVTSTRVGQMTDLDKLMLEIETNGSITAEDALKFSAEVLKSYFDLFLIEGEAIEPDFTTSIHQIKEKEQEEEEETKKETYTPIEILNFSPRTLNALINGGIGSIEQLVKCKSSKLANLRGFGKKAMKEVQDALQTKGLKMEEDIDI